MTKSKIPPFDKLTSCGAHSVRGRVVSEVEPLKAGKLFILVILLLVSIPNIVSLSNYAFAQVDTAWVRRYDKPTNGDAEAVAIAVYGTGNVSQICGDCNGDGVVDIGDVLHLINYLFRNGPSPQPLGVADANCDGTVRIGDIVYLVNYLFDGGPEPCC